MVGGQKLAKDRVQWRAFGISGTESLGSATREFVNYLASV
jgi:accessory colonization factor AcfC